MTAIPASDERRPSVNPADIRGVFLSTEPAGRRETRLALAAVLVSAVFFVAAVPFATRQLFPVAAADQALYQAKSQGRNGMVSMQAGSMDYCTVGDAAIVPA